MITADYKVPGIFIREPIDSGTPQKAQKSGKSLFGAAHL